MKEANLVARGVPQLTARAIGTGMLFGALLSLCNVYTGLKIGWGTNMSVTAALLSFGLWQLGQRLGARPYGILENNINQTAASAGASISSAGLVAPIPALAMLTGQTLSWPALSFWVFSVACVGVVVAVGLRRQMLEVDELPFPLGIATAETLREMYARGSEAIARVSALAAAALASGLLKVATEVWGIPKIGVPGAIGSSGALAAKGIGSVSLKNLGFAIDPGLLMVGVGGIIGMRACASLLLGAVVAWGLFGPFVLDAGWASPGKPGAIWFGPMVEWFLWPGVAMMVTAALTSVAFSARSIVAAIRTARAAGSKDAGGVASQSDDAAANVPFRWIVRFLLAAMLLSVVAQVALFEIGAPTAAAGVLLTFLLAVVAGRVSGETGITPIGAMGKVTQLTFGVISPGDPTTNLMAANVTGGAASQCADMLHDLRAGKMLGAWPRHQAVAQVFGVLAGALAGSAAYLILIPNPSAQLLTTEWPAPAVAQWKAVAEVFAKGFGHMPQGSVTALAIGGGIGIVLALLEKRLPPKSRKLVPSPGAVGLAIIIPPYISMAMFVGGAIAWMITRSRPAWAERFIIAIAAGLIAGESLTGVGIAVQKILGG